MKRQTRSSFKRRMIVAGLAMFMSVSLISTGFAAFVISSQSKAEGGDNIQVGVISDKAMKITINNQNNLGTFKLDINPIDNRGLVRASGQEEGEGEVMSITISGSISNPSYLNSLTLKLDSAEENDDFIQTAITAQYIESPEEYVGTGYSFTSEEIAQIRTNGTFSHTITLKWGAHFNGYNPGFYYDNEYYDTGTSSWVAISTGTPFEGNNAEIVADLADFKRVFHKAEGQGLTDDAYFLEHQNEYVAKKYKVTITASAA